MSRTFNKNNYILSPYQENIIFQELEQKSPECFNIQIILKFQEKINVPQLKATWKKALQNFPILKLHYNISRNGTISPEMVDDPEINLHETDWRNIPEQDFHKRLQNFLEEDARNSLISDNSPLWRWRVFHSTTLPSLAILTIHQSIIDYRSIYSLLHFLLRQYFNDSDNHLDTSYPSISLPHNQVQRKAGNSETHRSYWMKYLKNIEGFTPKPDFPLPSKPPSENFKYQKISQRLDKVLSDKLHQFMNNYEIPLDDLFTAITGFLLHRLTDRDDIVFVKLFDLRNDQVLEKPISIGYFLNLLPVRITIPSDVPILQWLNQLTSESHELQPVRETPLNIIKKWLHLSGRESLPSTLLVVNNFNILERLNKRFSEVEIEMIERSPVPLTIVVNIDRDIELNFHFQLKHWDTEYIKDAILYFQNILKEIIDYPQKKVREINLLDENQLKKIKILSTNGKRTLDITKTFPAIFSETVQKFSTQPAVYCNGETITYQQLNNLAGHFAQNLTYHLDSRQKVVAVCLPPSIEWVVAFIGILKTGNIYLPLDPDYPEERLKFMLEDSQAALVVTSSNLKKYLQSTGARVLAIEDLIKDEPPTIDSEINFLPSSEDLAYLIYTSGSTGQPKGALIHHLGLINLLEAQRETFKLTEADRIIQLSSISFDASIWEITLTIGAGACLFIPNDDQRKPGADLVQFLRQHHITTMTIVPSVLAVLQEDKFPDLKNLIVAGEACPLNIAKKWSKGRNFYNAYGPTETTIWATVARITPDTQKMTIGRPILNTNIYILDKAGRLAPAGVPGEIAVVGPGVGSGYINRPELNREKFISAPEFSGFQGKMYRTGDLGRFLPDGQIEFLGRIDQQIKLYGYRIEPGEIENQLLQFPEIKEAAVQLWSPSSTEKRLVAYVTTHSGRALDEVELRQFLGERMPRYMIPSIFVWLEELPRLPSGKIDRKALLAPDTSRLTPGKGFTPPRTNIEKLLAKIWQDVLRVEKVGIHDNFFELGGDSILSIQIVARAHQKGMKITPRDIFQHQTIAELAQVVESAPELRAEQELVSGPVPLTSIQHWFFEQDLANPHHFNQSFMLEVDQLLDVDILQKALRELQKHHDMLRARFYRKSGKWSQRILKTVHTVPVETFDLSHLSEEEQQKALQSFTTRLQSSLHLQKGPLIKAALFHRGGNQSDLLFLTIHHLAVDGVSWRILLEDLQSVYRQIANDEPVALPPKTTSYQFWAERLWEYAQEPDVLQELEYWQALANIQDYRNPVDNVTGENLVESIETLEVAFDEEKTRAFVQEAPQKTGAQIQEILLTAIAQAFGEWTGREHFYLDLEGHGREELIEGVELSRTVGWFTSIFPVMLRWKAEQEPLEKLKTIQEQLSKIPRKGIGFGLLRYLTEDREIRRQMQRIPQPEVSFNYLGQFSSDSGEESLIRISSAAPGLEIAPQNKKRHLIEMNAIVVDGVLKVFWSFSKNFHSIFTIKQVMNRFEIAMNDYFYLIRKSGEKEYAPEDFPLAKLNAQQLDQISDIINKIDGPNEE